MRLAAALLFVLLAAGCRGAREREEEARPERPRRDYLSANRAGLAFLGDTIRDGRRMRRDNLRVALQVSRRGLENREQRRHGRTFAIESVFQGHWTRVRELWANVERNARENRRDDAYERRFGFLDSGD